MADGAHFCQDVADDLVLRVLRDEEELRPREAVVEVVLHLVVLGEAREVAVLHLEEVIDRRVAYAHLRWCCAAQCRRVARAARCTAAGTAGVGVTMRDASASTCSRQIPRRELLTVNDACLRHLSYYICII